VEDSVFHFLQRAWSTLYFVGLLVCLVPFGLFFAACWFWEFDH